MDKNYLQTLLAKAKDKYPFISPYDPMVETGSGPYYAETWPVGETGDKDYPRPQSFPTDRTGVMVYRPEDFGSNDLAAEMLHIDPWANTTRNMLQQLLRPEQVDNLKRESGDYKASLDSSTSPDKAMSNAVDSAMRGYTVGQWPEEANASMHYSPEQTNLLQMLKQYMGSGVYPLKYSLPPGR